MDGITQKANLRSVAESNPASKRLPPAALFGAALALLLICFIKPIIEAVRLSFHDDMYSHVPLIPFISAYLVWTRRRELPAFKPAGFLPALAGLVIAGVFLFLPVLLGISEPIAALDLRLLALLVLVIAAAASTLGLKFTKSIAFPLAFLLFALPLPPALINPLEIASQRASADAYSWMLDLTGSTYYREGQVFALPGLNLQVAQECSGIRSSFVLFMVSLLAGYMFLHSPWRRLGLAIFVFPLGIARNAFRIFVLSMLTIHWDKRVIDSPLHHKGGPIFFAISLIPFALFLMWLCRREQRRRASARPPASP